MCVFCIYICIYICTCIYQFCRSSVGESLIKAEGALLSSGKPAPSWTREGDFDVLYMFLRISPAFSSSLYIFIRISFVFSSSLYTFLRIYFVFSSLLYTFFLHTEILFFCIHLCHLRFSIFLLYFHLSSNPILKSKSAVPCQLKRPCYES